MRPINRFNSALLSALAAIVLLAGASVTGAALAPADSFYAAFNNRLFVDENNTPFYTDSLQNKLTLFNFFFTGCSTVCPTQTAQLANVMEQLPEDVRSGVEFVSVSVQPLVDKPKKLKAFRDRFHLEHDNWRFLVGEVEDTRMLAEELQLIAGESTGDQIDHRTELWLVNRQGMLVQQYQGHVVDVPRLVMEIQQLSKFDPVIKYK